MAARKIFSGHPTWYFLARFCLRPRLLVQLVRRFGKPIFYSSPAPCATWRAILELICLYLGLLIQLEQRFHTKPLGDAKWLRWLGCLRRLGQFSPHPTLARGSNELRPLPWSDPRQRQRQTPAADANEVLTLCENFKFSGQGQRETPVADARGIVHIIMLPPCRAGAPVEAKICQRLLDYFRAGHEPLHAST